MPVPFHFVQLGSLFLTFSLAIIPISITCLTNNLAFAMVTSAISVGAFYALFIVADQMEDPFGENEMDMPLADYHRDFMVMLRGFLSESWEPGDTWTRKEGRNGGPPLKDPPEQPAKSPPRPQPAPVPPATVPPATVSPLPETLTVEARLRPGPPAAAAASLSLQGR